MAPDVIYGLALKQIPCSRANGCIGLSAKGKRIRSHSQFVSLLHMTLQGPSPPRVVDLVSFLKLFSHLPLFYEIPFKRQIKKKQDSF